jgi:hypothetical protein
VPFLERDPVELVGGIEDAVGQHLVELEILLQLVAIDCIALLPDLLGVEIPVGRGRLESCALRLRQGDDVRPFLALLGGHRGREPVEEADRRRAVLRHLVVERIIGPVGRSEQRRLVGAQLRDFADECAGVVGIAMLGAVETCLEQLLARVVAGQRGERRLLGRVLKRKDIAGQLAVLRSLLRGG